jgi:hypothetical protein
MLHSYGREVFMKRISAFSVGLALALAVVRCTATAAADGTTPPDATVQTAPAAAPASPPSGERRGGRNLQVLPQDIPRPELIALMRTFTRSLGVKCDHCHEAAGEELDFPSDAKQTKQIARVMLRMTQSINNDHLSKVSPRTPENRVTCYTCHRGSVEPVSALPPLPPKPES